MLSSSKKAVPLTLVFKTGVVKTALVNVLLVNVSVVALPTNVSVEVGKVIVPEFVIEDITGAVNVLLVNVSVVALPTNVSVALGKVIVLSAETSGIANVISCAFAEAPSNTNELPCIVALIVSVSVAALPIVMLPLCVTTPSTLTLPEK